MQKPRPESLDTETLDLSPPKLRKPQRFAVSRNGMVATQHYLATDAGVEMLEAGGNAVDAAVAAAYALGVCEPAASGLGGQTMMLIHLAKTRRTFALDGSSRAPNLTALNALSKDERNRGHKATTVPSTPAVLNYARDKYGTLKPRQVLAPAIRFAEEGYLITELQQRLSRRERKHFRAGTAATLFLKEGQRTYKVGERFKQPILAKTLKRLAEKGTSDFYTGAIADSIHRDMIRNKGLIRRDDLAQVPRPIERRPVACHFEGSRVFTFPPPGAGRTLIEMLNIISHVPAKYRNPDTPRGAICLAHVIQQAFRDRTDRPFDPNFYAQVSRKRMLSVDYAQKVSKEIRKHIRAHGETTHLSVMDRFGNVVALTQSLERVFGACAATPELGFLYNNYMTAFETENIRHPYYLRPNAVPWASVAPTIIFRGKKPWLAIGSPGSERIVSSILQVLLRLQKQSPYDAVAAPRLHCSLEGKVSLEASRMRSDIPPRLRDCGFEIDERDPYSFYLGCVQLVMREGDKFLGVADPRRDGASGGP
ncbi:MAG: gamma-glutamyltransferase family protein [Planctomycetota bacterium]|jgi:gamma-glutamyltranspeptidase/glutathione hydrolase